MSVVFIEPSMSVSTWRTLWPGRELARRGHDVRIVSPDEGTRRAEVFLDDDVILHITSGTWMESPTEIATPFSLVQRFKPACKRLWLSFDDDLTQLWHVQARPEDVSLRMRLFIADIPVICRQAFGVIVTTPRLAEVYGRWANEIRVCENYLPRWVFDLPRPASNGRLGWMGTLEVHSRDLELLAPFAADLPPMHLIGTGPAGAKLLTSWGVRDVTTTPIIRDQRALYTELSRCRAAVVPLVTTGKVGRFNAGKSWIKPYEFLARGVPVVASPHREYDRLPFLPTASPGHMLESVMMSWEDPWSNRLGLLDEGWAMEARGGDQWERALDTVLAA